MLIGIEEQQLQEQQQQQQEEDGHPSLKEKDRQALLMTESVYRLSIFVFLPFLGLYGLVKIEFYSRG